MWFIENMATILISGVLLLIVVAIVFFMVRNKKKGKSSCGSCGNACGGCSMSGSCHK